MLASLTIQNIVLIKQLTIEFGDGLCVLTGETGAGKSILLDSLALAIGARAEMRLLRKGASQAAVTAVFEAIDPDMSGEALHDAGLIIEPGEALVLRRILTHDGRSRAYINDQPVSAGLLRRIGTSLVEIHGQFDTQGLLNPAHHRFILDAYAGLDDTLETLWHNWQDAQAELSALQKHIKQSRDDEEYLRDSLKDLDTLVPEAGEEETLSALRDQLRHREQALKALSDAHHGLSGDKDPVSRALKTLEGILDRLPPGSEAVITALDRALNEAEDARNRIETIRDDLYYAEHNLEDVDERLNALRAQARKHNCAVDDLPAKRTHIASLLDAIEHREEALAAQVKAVEKARNAYVQHAAAVRVQREEAAAKLDQLIAAELPPLKLDKARFMTVITPLEETQWGPHGTESVHFLVSTNPQTPPGPLHKIASGGEMARFMLALKVVTARSGSACTLVFDEVDAGVGGAVADAVGQRLARLAEQEKQVMVVTHAPQIAARAGAHYIVRKQEDPGSKAVLTDVINLAQAETRREEIARMLAGETITAEARAAAEKLMQTG